VPGTVSLAVSSREPEDGLRGRCCRRPPNLIRVIPA
jgi:hypothetical protein